MYFIALWKYCFSGMFADRIFYKDLGNENTYSEYLALNVALLYQYKTAVYFPTLFPVNLSR